MIVNYSQEAGAGRTLFGALNAWVKMLFLAVGFLTIIIVGWEVYCRAQLDIGRREWARVKGELEAKGEKLDWTSFLPKPVPDEENFVRTPLLEAVGYRQNFDMTIKRRLDSRSAGTLAGYLPDLDKNQDPDIEGMANIIRTNPPPATPFALDDPAAMIIHWFEPLQSDFDELRSASLRPYAQWRVNPTNSFNDPIPNFVVIRSLAQQMAVLACAHIANNEPDAALADIRVNLKLAVGLEHHPTLVAMMIGGAIDQLTAGVIRQGMNDKRWNDSELAELERWLRPIDLPTALQRSMRCERATMNQLLDDTIGVSQLAALKKSWLSPLSGNNNFGMPAGWGLQSLAEYDECVQKYGIELYDNDREIVRMERIAQSTSFLDQIGKSKAPRHFLVQIGMPNLKIATITLSRTQTRINQARIAIALERFRIRRRMLPDDLSSLVPEFIDELPHDLIGGEPLHYQKSEDGGYVLWSVAWNGIDEKGKRSDDREAGDWVWTGK